MEKIRVAVIGLGGRGYGLLSFELLNCPKDITVTAVCDVYQDRVDKTKAKVQSKGGNTPFCTTDYHDLLTRDDVDLMYITTAWGSHVDIAVDSMKAGKYTALEVGGAYSIDDCWRLVDIYEETRTPFMLLENCCFGQYETSVLRMVREGLFGEIVYCQGGYQHDLRDEIANGKENRHYRLNEYLTRNCENYPTHEMGPIAKVLNINRGNRLVSLSSFASVSRGLHDYVLRKKPDDKELAAAEFKQGDIVTTVLKTVKGQTIVLTLDTTLPRVYSRGFCIRGTRGMYEEDNNSVFIDGVHNKYDFRPYKTWNNAKRYAKKYPHRIWAQKNKLNKFMHGGMDTLTTRAMIESYRKGGLTPIDVYDAATWMAITALSEQSIQKNGAVVDFPDFTRGKWENRTDIYDGIYSLDK